MYDKPPDLSIPRVENIRFEHISNDDFESIPTCFQAIERKKETMKCDDTIIIETKQIDRSTSYYTNLNCTL